MTEARTGTIGFESSGEELPINPIESLLLIEGEKGNGLVFHFRIVEEIPQQAKVFRNGSSRHPTSLIG